MSGRIRCAALALVLSVAVAACDEDEGPEPEVFRADLSGNNEVPVRTTPASGSAEVTINTDNTITHTIDVTNIRNVSAAHIHGPALPGTNTGVVATLFTSTPVTGLVTGRLASGTVTNTDNPATVSMDSLLVWIRTGRAYVNVHTNDGVAPTNTGPGDFPGGEVRGQLVPR